MPVTLWVVDLMMTEGERKPNFSRFLSFESACKFGKKILLEGRILKFAVFNLSYEDDELLEHQRDAQNNENTLDIDDDEITICSTKKRR